MDTYEQYIIRTRGDLAAFSLEASLQYRGYRDKIYGSLMNMRPGQTFDIPKLVNPANIPLFIKIVCLFVRENSEYTFSDDYKVIKRNR